MSDKGPNTDKSAKDQQEKKPVLKLVKTEDVDVSSDARLHAAEVKVAEETREDIAEELSVRDEDVEIVSEKEGEFTRRSKEEKFKGIEKYAEEALAGEEDKPFILGDKTPPSKPFELERKAEKSEEGTESPAAPTVAVPEEVPPDTEVMEDEDQAPDTQRSPVDRPANFDEKQAATEAFRKPEEAPTKSEAAPTEPSPKISEEFPELPSHIQKAFEAAAAEDEEKKKNLMFFWKLHKTGREQAIAVLSENVREVDADLAMQHVKEALDQAEADNIPLAVFHLDAALVKVGLLDKANAAPDPGEERMPIVGTALTAAAAEAGKAAETKEAAEEKKTEEEKKPKETFDKPAAVESFMESVGFPFDENDPASLAIRGALYGNVKGQTDLDQLRNFINDPKYSDAIDEKYGPYVPESVDKLKTELDEKEPELEKLEKHILRREKQLQNQKKPPTTEEASKLEAEVDSLYPKKRELKNEIKELKIAYERAQKKETAETTYIERPEQLLGMINIFFAKRKMKGGTPNYAKIMTETHEQLQAQYDAMDTGTWATIRDRLLPQSWFMPRLTSTLQKIREEDDSLKELTPEQMTKLAKAWKTPAAVRSWVLGLGGKAKETENMQGVVPTIIGHLTAAVNLGGVSHLNTVSVKRGRALLKNMREAVHQYAIESAKKGKGGSLEKMSDYFQQMNGINESASKVNYDLVANSAWWSAIKNAGKTVGVAGSGAAGFGVGYAGFVGATTVAGWGSAAYSTLAGLSALETIGLGAGAASAGLAAGSLGVKDPKMKAWMRRTSFRLAAATGFGALTVASIPWATLPSMISTAASGLSGTPWLTLGAAAGGFFLPDVWKNRKGITKKVPGVVGGTAKTTLKLGLAAGGLGLAALAFGLPLISRRYREAFFGPLVGKLPSIGARPSPMPAMTPATAPANDNALPLKRPLPRAA